MKTFKIHLKGSNTPAIVRGYSAEYTKEFLVIRTNRRITAQYLKAETQGYYEELSDVDFGLPNLIPAKTRKRGPRPEIIPSQRKHDTLPIQ
ncbi:MAG: hypothetical protein JO033_07970 [Acidobacteriaceae bacterium]|nr:hypothetical protein [Acidobacteriaceae bacterium]